MMRILHIYRAWVIDHFMMFPMLSMFVYYARTFRPTRKNCHDINMISNGTNLNNNPGVERFSHLDISTKYQCLIDIMILIPKVWCFL